MNISAFFKPKRSELCPSVDNPYFSTAANKTKRATSKGNVTNDALQCWITTLVEEPKEEASKVSTRNPTRTGFGQPLFPKQ